MNLGQFKRSFNVVNSRLNRRRDGRHHAAVLNAVAVGFGGLFSIDVRNTYTGPRPNGENALGHVELFIRGGRLAFINPSVFEGGDGLLAEIFIHEALHLSDPGAPLGYFGEDSWGTQCAYGGIARAYAGTRDNTIATSECYFR